MKGLFGIYSKLNNLKIKNFNTNKVIDRVICLLIDKTS